MTIKYKIIAKYIKDLIFKIPDPKTFFLLSKNISNYKIQIDIKSNQFRDKIIEVETCLSLKPIQNNFKEITTKIIHSTIVELDKNIKDKESLEEIILIKVPSEIYQEIRSSFIFLFEKSGFKDIKIDEKVDFKLLHKQRKIQ
jgi:preprotein translocase subunit SecB|tara:strand:+ start:2016 stop:2441 length:426 start_codon:yes stop_codon:yes gene_type:complete